MHFSLVYYSVCIFKKKYIRLFHVLSHIITAHMTPPRATAGTEEPGEHVTCTRECENLRVIG